MPPQYRYICFEFTGTMPVYAYTYHKRQYYAIKDTLVCILHAMFM